MKKLVLFLFLITNMLAYSQELLTDPQNGFVFPLGTKFTIKLHPKDSTNFDISIIEFEPFQETIDTWNNDSLFKEEGNEGTIEFYFCIGTSGKSKKEKKKNTKMLLVMKNRSNYSLSYLTDIQTLENGEFKETSNVGTFSGAKGIEMWPYMIYNIGIHDFKIMK